MVLVRADRECQLSFGLLHSIAPSERLKASVSAADAPCRDVIRDLVLPRDNKTNGHLSELQEPSFSGCRNVSALRTYTQGSVQPWTTRLRLCADGSDWHPHLVSGLWTLGYSARLRSYDHRCSTPALQSHFLTVVTSTRDWGPKR